jgi:hypothetical protein
MRLSRTLAALSLVLGGLAGCSDDSRPPTGPEVRASLDQAPEIVPSDTAGILPRGVDEPTNFVNLSDDSLWTYLAQADGVATIGIKAPEAKRGVWKGKVIVGKEEKKQGIDKVVAKYGVELLEQDTLLPIITARIPDEKALKELRKLPEVDYIEPDAIPHDWFYSDGVGCSRSLYVGPTMYSPSGDVMPDLYGPSWLNISPAWNRSIGRGITIGLTDTGIFGGSEQMGPYGRFTTGASAGRTAQYLNANPKWTSGTLDYYDCSHGTRMGGVMAAPRDGRGPIGVAYGANFISVRHNTDVVVSLNSLGDARNAIRVAAEAGSHIIVMAWGTTQLFNGIDDEIAHWAYNAPTPRLFIGAAGTVNTCSELDPYGIWRDLKGTLYPAKLASVVAVTAIDRQGRIACDVHGGREVDLSVYYDYPTASVGSEVWSIRGSSSATAVVAGAAALVWAKYNGGSWDTRRRLFEAAKFWPNKVAGGGYSALDHNMIGYGPVDVMKAVGGMTGATLNGCNRSDSCQFSYTLGACKTVYFYAGPIGGDGPYTYRWSTGSTGSSTSLRICPSAGRIERYSVGVTVTDADALGSTAISRNGRIEVRSSDPDQACPTCPV